MAEWQGLPFGLNIRKSLAKSPSSLACCRGVEPLTVGIPGLGERGRVYSVVGSNQPG